jgi:hypothetical protein
MDTNYKFLSTTSLDKIYFNSLSFDTIESNNISNDYVDNFPKNIVEIYYKHDWEEKVQVYGYYALDWNHELICKLKRYVNPYELNFGNEFVYAHYYDVSYFAIDLDEAKLKLYNSMNDLIKSLTDKEKEKFHKFQEKL